MIDFGQWLNQQAPVHVPEPEPMLPVGVWGEPGQYYMDCCCCGRTCDITEWIDDIMQKEDTHNEQYRHYCGGSDRCCP